MAISRNSAGKKKKPQGLLPLFQDQDGDGSHVSFQEWAQMLGCVC